MNAHTAVPDASGAESIAPTAESADVDEATVVARAQAGQEAAFEWLYAKYHTRFYNFVYRLMGSAPDAEDLTADAFLKMWLALPKTSDDLRFRFQAWGYRVCSNVCLDALRHRKLVKWSPLTPLLTALGVQSGTPSGADAAAPVPGGSDGRFVRAAREALTDADRGAQPEAAAVDGEDAEEVRAILAELHPRYRAVLELRAYRDLSYDEIAAAMATTRFTIKSVLFRGREQFREVYARTTRRPGCALEPDAAAAIAARAAPAITGAEVLRRRQALGLSQWRLSRRMRCHHTSLGALERLDRGGPGLRRRAVAALEQAERGQAAARQEVA